MNKTHSERRHYPRKEVLAPGVMRLETNGKSYTAQTIVRNISGGGLQAALYEFEEDLARQNLENTTGIISFRLADTGKEYTVFCCAKNIFKLTYTIQLGAEFSEISGSDKREIEEYCAR